MPDSKYDDEQAETIFKLAAERQEAVSGTRLQRKEGYSLQDLQEIAAEAGIQPEHVAAAARSMRLPKNEPKILRGSGLPEAAQVTRIVPSSLTEREWETDASWDVPTTPGTALTASVTWS